MFLHVFRPKNQWQELLVSDGLVCGCQKPPGLLVHHLVLILDWQLLQVLLHDRLQLELPGNPVMLKHEESVHREKPGSFCAPQVSGKLGGNEDGEKTFPIP